jgi:hypothetical protein
MTKDIKSLLSGKSIIIYLIGHCSQTESEVKVLSFVNPNCVRTTTLILLLLPVSLIAQSVKISGVVRSSDQDNLPLAHIVVLPDSITSVSDKTGNFSVLVSPGEKKLILSFTGYESHVQSLTVHRDTVLTIHLQPKINQLQEVVIVSNPDLQTALFESTRSGTNLLRQDDITNIPVLGGEADMIKVLQLMPGTLRGVEGSSDLFVRGGAADQNLVLLDDATVYNTSHLFGFVSVFNPDILQTVEAVNGGFPADMGGRLSSILDVRSNTGIADKTVVSGDVGLIASRLYVEQPIIEDKASIWVAGRRTYIDKVVRLIDETLPYFFYDLNAKISLRPSPRDEVALSFYTGEDILELFRDRNNDGEGFLTTYEAGNSTQTLSWRRKLTESWYSSVSLLRTSFQYEVLNEFRDNRMVAFSDIRDVGARFNVANNALRNNAAAKFGVDWTRHSVSPSVVNASGRFSELLSDNPAQGRTTHELAFYGLYEWNLSSRWLINTGLRTSLAIADSKIYGVPEPRVSARYKLSHSEALKFNYSRMAQYMHRVSNSAVTSPTDVWYPVTDSIRPQTAHQFSAVWQRTFTQPKLFISAEVYYKYMDNLVGFEEGTNLFFNTEFESKLVQGKGSAYGLELLVRKESGKLTGWISYTLSRTSRQFDALNNSLWFPSRYDRRHNGALVAQYALHNRWSVSMVWEYISGSRFTPVIGQYVVTAPSSTGIDLLPVYAPVNSVKLSDTHRLDLGIKFKSKPNRKFRYEWFAGVYNVYNRSNPVGITIEQDEADGSLSYEQPGLFGLLPFVSYGFKF